MRTKQGVVLNGLDIDHMWFVMLTAEAIWASLGHEIVFTSALDGKHKEDSKHYKGKALDLRTRYFVKEEAVYAAERLQKLLGSKYFVLLESNHIHVQYNG